MLLLYPENVSRSLAIEPNLHSTMLLLYLRVIDNDGIEKEIYIPLCFYFICDVPHAEQVTYNIYIPLCFYFISLCMLTKNI